MNSSLPIRILLILFLFSTSRSTAQLLPSVDTIPFIKGNVNSIDLNGRYRVYGGKFEKAGRQTNGFAVFNKHNVKHLNPFTSIVGDVLEVVSFEDGWLAIGDFDYAYDTAKIQRTAFLDKSFTLGYNKTKAIEKFFIDQHHEYSKIWVKGDTLIATRTDVDKRTFRTDLHTVAYNMKADSIIWSLKTSGRFDKIVLKDSLLLMVNSYPNALYDYDNTRLYSSFFSINVDKGKVAQVSPVITNGGVSDVLLHKNQLFITGSFTQSDQYSRKYFVQYNIKNGLVSSWTPVVSSNSRLSRYNDDIFCTTNWPTDSLRILNYKDEKTEYLNLNLEDNGSKINIHSTHVIDDTLYLFLENNDDFLWKIDPSKPQIISKHKYGLEPSQNGRFKFYKNKFVYVELRLQGITSLRNKALLFWDKVKKDFVSNGNSFDSISAIVADDDIYVLGRFSFSSRSSFYKVTSSGKTYSLKDGGIAANSNNKINKLHLYKNQLLVVGKVHDGNDAYPLAGIDLSTGAIKYYGGKGFTGEILTSALDADTLYLGGDFKTMDKKTRDYVAALDLNKNSVLRWAPAANNLVTDIKIIDSNWVFLSGPFNYVGGATRNMGAYINRHSGAANAFSIKSQTARTKHRYHSAIIDTILLVSESYPQAGYGGGIIAYSTISGNNINLYDGTIGSGFRHRASALVGFITDGADAIHFSNGAFGHFNQEANLVFRARNYRNTQNSLKLNPPKVYFFKQDCDELDLVFERNNPTLLHVVSQDSNKTFNLKNQWYNKKVGSNAAHYFDNSSYVLGHGFNLNIDELKNAETRYLYTYSCSGYGDSVIYGKTPTVTKLRAIERSKGITILDDTIQCFAGHSFSFKTNVADSSNWYFSDTTQYVNTDSISHSFKRVGHYTLNFKYGNGSCAYKDSVQLRVLKSLTPKIEFVSDSVVCKGSDAAITTNVVDTFNSIFSWRIDGVEVYTTYSKTLYAQKVAKPFRLTVSIKNNYKCSTDSAFESVNYQIDTLDVSSFKNSYYQCLTGNSFTFKPNTSAATEWYMGDGTTLSTSDSIVYTYKKAGNYRVTFEKINQTACGWTHSFGVQVVDDVVPEFHLISDTIFCENSRIKPYLKDSSDDSDGAYYRIKWYLDDEYLKFEDNENGIDFKAEKNVTVKAVLGTKHECALEDTIIKSVTIKVDKRFEKPDIFLKQGKLKTTAKADKYIWFKNQVNLKSDSQSITTRGPGVYFVRLRNFCGNVDSEDFEIKPKSNSISNAESGRFKIYPNPAQNFVSILTQDAIEHEYRIFNAQGKIIQQGNFANSDKLGISGLSNGVYYLMIDESSGQRLVIAR